MENLSFEVTDNELVELSKYNPDRFGELVTRYQDRLFRYIKRISYFPSDDIDDIVQDTFLKVYKSLNAFDDDLKFSTWIYQIARNTMIDAIRKKQSRPQVVYFEEDDMLKMLRSNIDIHIDVAAKDRLHIMRNIIDAMPYAYKEVMVLRFLEEKSYEEIGDIVKKSKGTVASLINRGRKMLLDEARESFDITH